MNEIILGELNWTQYKVGRHGFIYYFDGEEWVKSSNTRNEVLENMIMDINQHTGGKARRAELVKQKRDLMEEL